MTWWAAWPQILVALLVLLAPGALVVRCAGGRSVVLIGAAAPVSVAIVAVAAIGAEAAGVAALWPAVVLVTAVLAAGAALVRPRRSGAGPRDVPRVRAAAAVALIVGASLVGWRVLSSLIAPDRFSQHFDIVFHLNAARRAAEGAGSSLTMGAVMGEGGLLSFYPAGWHDVVGLVVQTTGGTAGLSAVPVAGSAVALVVAAVVWPLGCIALVRAVAGPRPWALVAAGVLSAASGTFPLRLLDWGVLLPFLLGTALLPGVLALVVVCCGLGGDRPPGAATWAATVLAGLGLALAHTSAVVALAALAAPILAAGLVRAGRARRAAGRPLTPTVLLAAAAAAAVVAVWIVGRPRNGFEGWDVPRTLPGAVLAFLANAPLGGVPPFAVLAAMAVAVVVLLRRRERLWLLAVHVVAGVLLVAVSGVPRGPLRTLLVGPWYEDPFRVSAILVVPATALAAVGADLALRRLLLAVRRRRPDPSSRAARLAVPVLVLVLLVPATQVVVERDAAFTQAGYRLDDASPLVTPNEMRLFARLAEEVPATAVIANNPWDGSAVARALTGRRVLVQHMLSVLTDDQRVVVERLRDARTDPEVCPAVRRTGVRYVLDLGPYLDGSPAAEAYPGLDGLVDAGVAEEVDREGEAILLRLTVCG